MSNMGSHDPFEHLKFKLWPKKRLGVKLLIWLPTTKSRESPRFPCVQVACDIPLERYRRKFNFVSNFISIGGLHTKLWGPKVVGVSTLAISRLPLESLGTKCYLDVGLMERHKVYYKGEGGGFPPKSGSRWVLWIWVCRWLVLAPKMLQLCSNQLVVWFV